MASCKFEGGRCKGATHAKAEFRHNKKDTREKGEHSNKHIDKTKTHLNTSKYGLSYAEACQKYDLRIYELDQLPNQNKRKDRITLQVIEVPVPKDLPREHHQAFFDNVCDILIDFYGEKNLIDADYHFDEEHEYLNPETNEIEISRNHGHYEFIPEHDGKLNGKWFSSKANMIKLNNKVQKMCQKEFGVKFMDGSKKKGKKSTEQLKNESIEALREQKERLDSLVATQELLNEQKQKQIDELSIQQAELDKQAKEQEEQQAKLDKQAREQEEQQAKLDKQAREQEEQQAELNKQAREQEEQQAELDKQAREQQEQQAELNKQAKEIQESDSFKLKRLYGFAKSVRNNQGTMYDWLMKQEKIFWQNQRAVDNMHINTPNQDKQYSL